jgi:hypothetical protein
MDSALSHHLRRLPCFHSLHLPPCCSSEYAAVAVHVTYRHRYRRRRRPQRRMLQEHRWQQRPRRCRRCGRFHAAATASDIPAATISRSRRGDLRVVKMVGSSGGGGGCCRQHQSTEALANPNFFQTTPATSSRLQKQVRSPAVCIKGYSIGRLERK